ncbi:hypothetical protein BKA70DRAFT_136647 [Coprinopsis sp. MPI-PUGE-AT-0042]|nr:hypothetical protein BKA70DRAFT_136647 [Coprinopsis sp. MPI-PUGE-AT-0042]
MSPTSSSGSSTLVSPASSGARPVPQRKQTLYQAKNRPPTPFRRPTLKKRQMLPAPHWHPSMGMTPRPATLTEPFIPPGFSDPKPTPNPAKGKGGKPKEIDGYEGDDEKGRLRKTTGLAAPGYGSDSDAPSSAPRRKAGMQAVPSRGTPPGKNLPLPGTKGNTAKGQAKPRKPVPNAGKRPPVPKGANVRRQGRGTPKSHSRSK